MQTVNDIARDFTAMLRAGQFEEAGERFLAADVISVEPAGSMCGLPAKVYGIAAALEKNKTRVCLTRITNLDIDGPFITGDQFALFMDMVIVDRICGTRQPFTEIALYTVREGRIAEERYFYD